MFSSTMTARVRSPLAALAALVTAAATLTATSITVDAATAPPAAAAATGDIIDTPTGPVSALDVANGTTYFGGNFTSVGANTGGGAAVSSTTGEVNRAFPGLAGPIFGGQVGTADVVVGDGSGGFYIGGTLVSVGGVPRTGAAHILADGTVDPQWDPAVQGSVTAIAVLGSTVYLGGRFHAVNGNVNRRNAAAVDAATGKVKPWAPNPDEAVTVMTASGSTVYMGGWFGTVNSGVPRQRAAAVDATTGIATAWNPMLNGFTTTIQVAGSTVFVGGSFDTVNGTIKRVGLAAFDNTVGAVTSWDAQLNGGVAVAQVVGSTMYIGGAFTKVNGNINRNKAAAVNTASGSATAWNPSPDMGVNALTVNGSTVYLGGDFTAINGSIPRKYAAAVDSATGSATGWSPNTGGRVTAIHAVGPNVYLGGNFSHVNVVERTGAAAVGADGRVTAWNPTVNGPIEVIQAADTQVFLGGKFTTVNGTVARNNAAAVDATTGTASPWDPNLNNTVRALAVVGSTVYLGGDFTTANGDTTRNHAAAVDTTAGTVTPWDPDTSGDITQSEWYVDGSVHTLVVSGPRVFVGGVFTTLRGTTNRNAIAAVDTTAGLPSAWDPNVDGAVFELQVSNSTVYASGDFATTNGSVARKRLAAFDISTGTATSWSPEVDGLVKSMAVDGGRVYFGGYFWYANRSMVRRYAAAVDATTGTFTGWNPDFSGEVSELVVADSVVHAGGAFTFAKNHTLAFPSSFLSRLSLDVESPSQFVAMVPQRVVDTRVDPGTPMDYLQYIFVDVSDMVPPGTTAVAFNVTVTGQTASGYLNIAPVGTLIGSSTVNWSQPGETIANGHVTKVTEQGRLQIALESRGTAHIVLDITGYFAPPGSPGATLYSPADRRIYDSRTLSNPLQPGASRTVNINTGGAVQPVAPTAASINVTATGTTGSGVLTVAKHRSTTTSTINWTGPVQTMANAVITDVAPNGNFTVTNNGKTAVHVVVDLTGTFAPTASGATGAQFFARDPDRSYDSRFDPDGRLTAGQSRTTGHPIPADATAVVVNATVTGTEGTGYLSLTPPIGTVPLTSTVNWYGSPTTRANGTIVPVTDTANRAYVGGQYSTHYLLDIAGYFR